MRKILVLILFSILLISGCATPYEPQTWRGGYTDVQINTDSFIVSFKGREPLRTKQMALLRSAEVTLEHGYAYFVIAQVDDLSTIETYTSSYRNDPETSWGYDTRIHTTKRPHYVYTIICYEGKPATPSYSARMIVDNMNY